MEKVKCLRWVARNKMILDLRDMPELGVNEALLRVESCGVCGSDLKIIKHGNKRVKRGQITGHEISGQLIKTNKVKNYKAGDRVSVGADIPSNKDMAIGHELEGGFAQYMILNKETLETGPVKKIKDLEYDLACLAEPLACCINGFEKISFKTYDSILIMGCGPIGLMLAFLATKRGIKDIYMTDISDSRLNLIKNFDFINSSINTKRSNLKKWIEKTTKKEGVDLIFTANNNSKSHYQALSILIKQGVINFFGGLPSDAPKILVNTNQIHYQEAVLTGSHGSTPKQHSQAVELISKNRNFFKKLISKTVSIDNYQEAFESASNSKNLKIIIKPNK